MSINFFEAVFSDVVLNVTGDTQVCCPFPHTVNGTVYEVIVEEAGNVSSVPSVPSAPTPAYSAPTSIERKPKISNDTDEANGVKAPMPGTILDVKVSVGQAVRKGDVICVLEAMKMENDIPAPSDGIIKSVNVQKGASVNAGDTLVSLK